MSIPRLVLLLALAAAAPARADQTDPRLPDLFTQLRAAPSYAEAAPIEAQIWIIWGHSGNAEVDRLMEAGSSALAAGDGEDALAAFDQVVLLAPKFAEGWNKRATTNYLLGHIAESEADIARVLTLEPRHFGALSGLGLCETRRDRLPEAAEAFRRALALDPSMPGAKFNLQSIEDELAKRSI